MTSTPTSSALPMRVTRTARGTHIVHVRGFSRLQEQQCGVDGFVTSPPFAVAGLDWAVRYYPGSDEHNDHVGAFVELQTKRAVARAYVGLLLLDQTTGLAEAIVWDDDDPALLDATSSEDGACAWGTHELGKRSELKGSGFVRGDCLKIECVLDVCRGRVSK